MFDLPSGREACGQDRDQSRAADCTEIEEREEEIGEEEGHFQRTLEPIFDDQISKGLDYQSKTIHCRE
jgi:hypothetical protein